MRNKSRLFWRLSIHAAALMAAVLLLNLATTGVTLAEDDAFAPVESYSKQIDQLKSTFGDLNRKIDSSTKELDNVTDVQKARAEIEQLKAAVSNLLGAVADNGEVAMLGVKAEQRVDAKLKALETDTRFKPDERQFLIDQWRKLQVQTRAASQELGAARREFASLLESLQHNEDFIDELMQIRQAQKAIAVLHQLTSEIRDASGKLKALMSGIKPPST
jgi:chromosome segregation ATPase